MDINAVCEKREQAEILAGISGIGHIFHPGNTMPYVFRNENASRCRGFLSEPDLLIRNPDEIGFLKENGYSGRIYADHTLYTFNKASRDMLRAWGITGDTAPLELNYRELKLRGMADSELMIYGRVPMMITAGCVLKNSQNDKCEKDIEHGQDIILTDRLNSGFPVICCCRYCYNIILNSVPLSLHGHLDKVKALDPGSLRLYFTTENEQETRQTAEFYIRALRDEVSDNMPPFRDYTNGHFIKGAA